MNRFVIAAFVLGALVHRASANECNEYQPLYAGYVVNNTTTLPVNCPLVIFVHPDQAATFTPTVHRYVSNAPDEPLAATVVESIVNMDVTHDDIDGHCVDHYSTESVGYHVYTATGFDAQPGDRIQIGASNYVDLTAAAATCGEPVAPQFFCTSPVMPCDWGSGSGSGSDTLNAHDEVGCNAGGTGGAGALVFARGLVAIRRRRRAEAR